MMIGTMDSNITHINKYLESCDANAVILGFQDIKENQDLYKKSTDLLLAHTKSTSQSAIATAIFFLFENKWPNAIVKEKIKTLKSLITFWINGPNYNNGIIQTSIGKMYWLEYVSMIFKFHFKHENVYETIFSDVINQKIVAQEIKDGKIEIKHPAIAFDFLAFLAKVDFQVNADCRYFDRLFQTFEESQLEVSHFAHTIEKTYKSDHMAFLEKLAEHCFLSESLLTDQHKDCQISFAAIVLRSAGESEFFRQCLQHLLDNDVDWYATHYKKGTKTQNFIELLKGHAPQLPAILGKTFEEFKLEYGI